MTTHPIQFITTIGRVRGKLIPNIAPFATCLDTSYEPPYVQFSCALRQHSLSGQEKRKGKMNTFLNIKQNRLFIINIPSKELTKMHDSMNSIIDIIAYPYNRDELEDKINKAKLTKIEPFYLPKSHTIYPPLISQCLAHLECEVIDIHRPLGSDHHNITGKVVGTSYNRRLGESLDEIRENIVRLTFHHFGSPTSNSNYRYYAFMSDVITPSITFKLEENKNE